MEDKLVTVAIHTFEQAQILKTLLESEGIETYIHNVNILQPMVSAGVRVRIKETDLPKALSIIEKVNFVSQDSNSTNKTAKKHRILVPVDFSDYSLKACDLACNFAHSLNDAEVLLLHTYFIPVYDNMPLLDPVNYVSQKDESSVLRFIKQAGSDMENLSNLLNKKMKNGKLPPVSFHTKVKEGIPEEEIIRYGKECKPTIVIMGTRGKNRKEQDLIGSVTAEVIDRVSAPVFVIPENSAITQFDAVKNIAFSTNFAQKDLIAFERMMDLLKNFNFKIHFIHFEQDTDVWNEVKLAGIKEYFQKQYPEQATEYHVLKGKDILISLDHFIEEQHIDIISLTTYRRNLFSRLFNPSVARKMIFHAKTPMLILHA